MSSAILLPGACSIGLCSLILMIAFKIIFNDDEDKYFIVCGIALNFLGVATFIYLICSTCIRLWHGLI